MKQSESLFEGKTALLLVDLQNDFCHPEGTAAQRGRDVRAMRERLSHMASLLEEARSREVPVIHIVSEHSKWTASPSQAERLGRRHQDNRLAYCEPGSWGADNYYLFEPQPDEPIVIKHRYSGFVHTDLELILRTNNVEHLIISGVNTEVCLDSTARDAHMRDFYVTVPYDCAASTNPKHHYAALELLDGTFAEVVHS